MVGNLELVTDWVRVLKTEHCFQKRNPMWAPADVKMTTLCSNNKTLPIRFTICNFNNQGDHKMYGSCVSSIREIEMGKTNHTLTSPRDKYAGEMDFSILRMDLKPSLTAYLQSGWHMSIGVAVDFTLSNKPIIDPRSYHRQDQHNKEEMNLYERAIYEVCAVLRHYTHDNKFHFLGFGGEP